MKQIVHSALLTLALLLALPVSTKAQDALFEKFNDAEGITTVFISKTMLQMIPNVKAGKHDIGNIASKLDQLRILTCERPSMVANIKKQASQMYKNNQYEVIMQANEDGEHVTIYYRKLKNGKSEYALLADEGDEISIINVKGNVTLKDIQQLTGK